MLERERQERKRRSVDGEGPVTREEDEVWMQRAPGGVAEPTF